jgi:hypothetical protein
LKVSKSFQLGTFAPSLAVEIINLLDNYDLIIPSGDNLKAWEEDGTIPKVGKSGEDDVWNFRNSISNPRRMIYLSLNVDF